MMDSIVVTFQDTPFNLKWCQMECQRKLLETFIIIQAAMANDGIVLRLDLANTHDACCFDEEKGLG